MEGRRGARGIPSGPPGRRASGGAALLKKLGVGRGVLCRNLEKFCEAETIYIDRTFKASPQLFYQFFTAHAVYNGQHIRHTVNCIPTFSSYRQHHI